MQRLERLAAEKKDAKATEKAAKAADKKASKKAPVAKRGRDENEGSAACEKKGRKEPAAATITGNAALDAKLAIVKRTPLPEDGYDTAALIAAATAAGHPYAMLVHCLHHKSLLGQQCPVYDDCDDVRVKLNKLKDSTGATTVAMCKALGFSRAYGGKGETPINANSWAKMFVLRGKINGCQHELYYLGYVFCEKLRVAAGEPKTKKRLQCELDRGNTWGLPRIEGKGVWRQC
jgi:hypothetical protein